PELEHIANMPARWTKLIDLSQQWILEQTA
ncbi:hypothetical protein M670_04794, partial [Schinkia azotoformans MEV2011]